jgi:5-methyltetrahydrofolate--homocysteine methyltransferase
MKRKSITNILTLRQQSQNKKAPNIALSDFIAPKTGKKGLYGCFCVTTGFVLMSG